MRTLSAITEHIGTERRYELRRGHRGNPRSCMSLTSCRTLWYHDCRRMVISSILFYDVQLQYCTNTTASPSTDVQILNNVGLIAKTRGQWPKAAWHSTTSLAAALNDSKVTAVIIIVAQLPGSSQTLVNRSFLHRSLNPHLPSSYLRRLVRAVLVTQLVSQLPAITTTTTTSDSSSTRFLCKLAILWMPPLTKAEKRLVIRRRWRTRHGSMALLGLGFFSN